VKKWQYKKAKEVSWSHGSSSTPPAYQVWILSSSTRAAKKKKKKKNPKTNKKKKKKVNEGPTHSEILFSLKERNLVI
jgi:hypothetical protein